jgi:DNA-binding MarR family transcriptional regulator
MPSTARSAAHATSALSAACTCGRLRRAARSLTQLYDDAMAPSELRITQFSLLRTLVREGPKRIGDLASLLLLDRTAMSRNLEPLLARGLVSLTTGRDARTRVAAITRKGKVAFADAEPHWRRAQAAVARMVGRERLDALIDVLGELETLHPALAHDSRGEAFIPVSTTSRSITANRP